MKKSDVALLHSKAKKALKAAIHHLVQEHKRTGDPLIVWKNGRVVKLSPKKI
jgi:hypothetical protein